MVIDWHHFFSFIGGWLTLFLSLSVVVDWHCFYSVSGGWLTLFFLCQWWLTDSNSFFLFSGRWHCWVRSAASTQIGVPWTCPAPSMTSSSCGWPAQPPSCWWRWPPSASLPCQSPHLGSFLLCCLLSVCLCLTVFCLCFSVFCLCFAGLV